MRCRVHFSHGIKLNKEDHAFFVVVIWGATHLIPSYVECREKKGFRREEKEVANINVLIRQGGWEPIATLTKMGG